MKMFKEVLTDDWSAVESQVDAMREKIIADKVNSYKLDVLSQLNKMTPDQVSKMMESMPRKM